MSKHYTSGNKVGRPRHGVGCKVNTAFSTDVNLIEWIDQHTPEGMSRSRYIQELLLSSIGTNKAETPLKKTVDVGKKIVGL